MTLSDTKVFSDAEHCMATCLRQLSFLFANGDIILNA